MEKLCLRTKDVCRLLEVTERHARNILKKILEANSKSPHQLVTIDEFSLYYGLDPNEVRKCLR